jgi:hypothetical protein
MLLQSLTSRYGSVAPDAESFSRVGQARATLEGTSEPEPSTPPLECCGKCSRMPLAQDEGPSTMDLTHDAEYGAPRLLA